MSKILIVDDEPGLRMTLAANLELEGFEVVEAESGEQALELLETVQVDLMLTDVRMPGMNGVDLFQKVREKSPGLPVVLMTAFAVEQLVDRGLSNGAFTVLPKPFTIPEVVATVTHAARLPVVLVIDDAESLALATAASLEAIGVRAKAVTNADDALAAVSSGSVDLCVVDLVMPTPGPVVVEKLRSQMPELMVIAMSGHDVPDLIRHIGRLGMHTFLRKPFRVPELVRAVAMARRKAPDARAR